MVRKRGGDRADIGASPRDALIAALAARQHGVVARGQLHSLGLDRHAVRRRVDAGRLHPVRPGVFAVGHPSLTEPARLLAAVLSYGERAVVSHRSAAGHWGLLPKAPGRVDVISPASHQRPGTRRHRLTLAPGDAARRDGVPVTSVGRTLADLATVAPPAALERAVHEAQVRRLLSARELALAAARSDRRRGGRHLRRLLGEVDPDRHPRSELERRFLLLVASASLPAPRRNALVEVEGRLNEVDAAWPDRRVAVELDGQGFHRNALAWERDHERDARFRRAGWQVQRFTWRQVTEAPDSVRATVSALLGSIR